MAAKKQAEQQVQEQPQEATSLSVAQIKDEITKRRDKIKVLQGEIDKLESDGIAAAKQLIADIGGYEVTKIGEKKPAKKGGTAPKSDPEKIKTWFGETLRDGPMNAKELRQAAKTQGVSDKLKLPTYVKLGIITVNGEGDKAMVALA